MQFLEKKRDDIVENIFSFFDTKIKENPRATLNQVESELESLYIRFGHAWTGRSVVGDTTQLATIAGLECVRAECMELLKLAENEKRSA